MAVTISGDGSITGVPGRTIQFVTGSTTTSTSTTSNSYSDTGLSATITPSSSSSKVLVLFAQNFYIPSGTSSASVQIVRDATAVWTPSNPQLSQPPFECMLTQFYLDSPNTTSAATYKTQFKSTVSGQTTYAQDAGTEGLLYLIEVAA